MAFSATWAALQTQLTPRLTIPNWTARSGAIGEPFQIERVDPGVIVVHAPGATTLQSMRRKDFEAVYGLWDEYVQGRLPRKTFTPVTRYSKYIISILHWLQERSGGHLP